jgi:phosphohistidine phosphatase
MLSPSREIQPCQSISVLSCRGRKRFKQVTLALQYLGVCLDRLYCSPWQRAVETAELLLPLLDGESICSPALIRAPDQALLDEIRGNRVALVGHESWLGTLLVWLTTGSRTASNAFLLKRGGVAWLEGQLDPGLMILRAFLPPKVLRSLA